MKNIITEEQFFKAIRNDDIKTVKIYIDQHKNNPQALNIKEMAGTTAIMIAAALGHINILQELINAGADVNEVGSGGNTALIYAAREGQTESVEILISANADVNAKDAFQNTAIWHAADKKHFGVVLYLVEIKGIELPIGPGIKIIKDDKFPSLVQVKYYRNIMWTGHIPTGKKDK